MPVLSLYMKKILSPTPLMARNSLQGLYTILKLICDLRIPDQATRRKNTEAYDISED